MTIALVYNSVVVLHLLPRLAASRQWSRLFRVWFWIDGTLSLYGWIGTAVALLAWSYYWARHANKPELEVRLARVLLILLLLGSAVSLLLPLIPSKWAAVARVAIERHPGLARILPWGAVGLAVVIISLNSETRDRLLGNGRVLTVVGLGVLFVVMMLTLLGWWAV